VCISAAQEGPKKGALGLPLRFRRGPTGRGIKIHEKIVAHCVLVEPQCKQCKQCGRAAAQNAAQTNKKGAKKAILLPLDNKQAAGTHSQRFAAVLWLLLCSLHLGPTESQRFSGGKKAAS